VKAPAIDDRDLYSGMIRLHILHHASEEIVFGLGLQEELGRHGYKISAGTLYPILHALERKGYLRSTEQRKANHDVGFITQHLLVARRWKPQRPRSASYSWKSLKGNDS
jgi:PadR family transcriptional regulator PadR